MTATSDGDDERTPYSDMSDDEFLAELRAHLHDESWTLGHWFELERRGMDILDADAELGDAVRAQRDRTLRAFEDALAPIREQMTEQFRTIAPDLSHLMPKVDYSQFLPAFELDLPKLDLHEFVLPEIASFRADSVLDHDDMIAQLAEIQEEKWERDNEVRQAHLETAQAAARQVELLGQIEQRNQERHQQLLAGYEQVASEVREGHQPRWTLWLMLGLTAVAAVAAFIAAIASV